MLTEHPPEALRPFPERDPWAARLLTRKMWAALSLCVIWLAVLFVGLFGPSIVVTNTAGNSVWPVVVVVAFFAALATVPIARAGFRPHGDDHR